MKLELKHLVPYLPYGLKAKLSKEGVFNLDSEYRNEYAYSICTITDFTTYSKDLGGSIKVDKTKDYSFDFDSLSEIDIILRPLSDIFNGEYEDVLDEFSEVSLEAFKIAFLSELRPINAFDKINYTIATKLFENHFDVFGLIDHNLAIDINTI